ncbi:hypothetical protein K457DRAFT_474587 [Linnemannia elongata AG-77]|uniref:Uncharacterized protein n=1 Tax=Linnemannia elongata AG-77 TaxID=1314771 RepID=A0A197JY83_9FUNG|nr:hypothetical protein K457DRAFT_474587 [Linnemannia elongata AG-77]
MKEKGFVLFLSVSFHMCDNPFPFALALALLFCFVLLPLLRLKSPSFVSPFVLFVLFLFSPLHFFLLFILFLFSLSFALPYSLTRLFLHLSSHTHFLLLHSHSFSHSFIHSNVPSLLLITPLLDA